MPDTLNKLFAASVLILAKQKKASAPHQIAPVMRKLRSIVIFQNFVSNYVFEVL